MPKASAKEGSSKEHIYISAAQTFLGDGLIQRFQFKKRHGIRRSENRSCLKNIMLGEKCWGRVLWNRAISKKKYLKKIIVSEAEMRIWM